MAGPKKVNIDFQFVVPADAILEAARAKLTLSSQDERDVAKAMLDATELTVRSQDAFRASVEKDGTFDCAPYFDHWFGDALETAKRLRTYGDKDISQIAQCLIAQSEAIVHSKESFLKETKRVM
jgi:hypothetical protein